MTDAVLGGIPQVSGLDHTDQNTLDCLIRQYRAKYPRNELRRKYYDGKNVLKDFGISIPPQLKDVETVVGWPEKAVSALARRIRHDGFVIPGVDAGSLGVEDIWAQNRMELETPQAITSAILHSVAFLYATMGDTQSGEPGVLLTARSAMSGTGLWNPRRRILSAALSVIAYEEPQPGQQRLTQLAMYLPDKVLIITRDGLLSKWTVDERRHSLGRVPVEPMPFLPDLDRPFGVSRVNRATMSITDEAVRTVLRTEVSAEFYSAPQRYALGADPEAFEDEAGRVRTGWESILGRVLAIGRDEDGEVPTVGQFPQMTMQPHLEHMRSVATRFSGATNLPVSSLGVITDNPSSADAIYAAKEDLITEAEYAASVFGSPLANIMRLALMMREKRDTMPPEWSRLKVKWRDPATPSRSTAADAVMKTVTAFPWLAESEVALEQLGWDETTIARAMADKRKAAVTALTQRLAAQPAPATPAAAATPPPPAQPADPEVA